MRLTTPDERSTSPDQSAAIAQIDLSRYVRAGDRIAWGQGAGEPRSLVRALVEQRAQLGGVEVFLGVSFSETLRSEHADHIRFRGLGGFGTNARLSRDGLLEVVPCHMSAVPGLIAEGRIGVDVVFVQVSPADGRGRHSLGVVADYVRPAIAKARVVIAQIDERTPRTRGDTEIDAAAFTTVIHADEGPPEVSPARIGPVEQSIAERVAERIPDGAVLQFGIGSTPEAVAARLRDKRDLGIHTSLFGDRALDLIECGAVTNARKAVDRGIAVAGMLVGTRRLYDYAHENPALELRPIAYTHGMSVLAQLAGLVAVNSAVEVDLTGQVNAESLRGVHVGAVGGAVDFMRGAVAAPGGCSIIALPSTARHGAVSRIVPRLTDSVTTAARSDVDLVATEHGVADLRGMTLGERARRLLAIADPAFREELAFAVRELT
jgi:acyl-CoA hydrolase